MNDKMTFWNILKKQFRERKSNFFIQLIYGINNAVSPFIFICFPPLIIDYLITKSYNKTFLIISVFSLLSIFVKVLSNYIYAKFQGGVYYMPHQYNKKNIYKTIIMDFKYSEQNNDLENYNNSLNAAWTCCELVYDFFTTFIIAIVKFALIISILLTLDLYIVIFVIVVVIINYFLNVSINKKNKEYNEKRNNISRFVNYYDEILVGLNYGKEKRLFPKLQHLFYRKYEDKIDEIYKHDNKVRKYNFFVSSISNIITTLQNIVIYGMMIYKYSLNQISLGSFFTYIGIANEMYNAFSSLVNVSIQLSKFNTYAKSYNKFMDYENVFSTNDINIDFNKNHVISFENVSFKYPNTDKMVLQNISFKIIPNKKTYIVGDNGSGKTTIIKLLLRLYEPTAGVIKLDGIKVSDYNYNQYLKMISCIFQDFKLYKISIKDNICFDKFDITSFNSVINQCDLNDVIGKLKFKENSNIDKEYNDDGIGLSGGECQKIAIARSLYKNSQMYIFDEPTSSLDPINEKRIISLFNKISKNNTGIIVSHRMSTASLCNNIIYLENGQIIEEGSFKKLMEIKGKFYENYKMQSRYYE